ncbi:hypothetical protein D9611_012821 [Ephemerocybe angulata]|uniref:Ribonucleoside-diphosphate reductase n=1 Tax=Ephemerocybe angulata TaxID=980116 RepID=A0A8H5CBH1_9AGAR|nr:hypothetical protein D9611_012821 [Tulosesus angulatus]
MLVVSCRREMGGSPSFFLVVECTHIIRRPRSIEEYDGFKVLVLILKPRLIRRLALLMGDRMVHEGCIAALDTLCQLGASSFGLAVDSSSIDRRLAKLSASLEPQGSIYGIISSALEMDALYQSTEGTFSGAMKAAYSKGLLAPEFMNEVDRCAPVLDSLIRPDGDQHFTYSALRLLQKSYLLRYGQALYERPQYMWLRVAVYLHSGDMDSIRLFYSHMSTFKVVPSASVLCQSGTQDPPSHPCYQYDMSGCPDELFRLMKTISTVGRAGGNIGIGMQNMPAQSSLVDGLKRSGVVHALHSLKACMRVMDRGLDAPEPLVKVYLEPWHAEIEGFLRTVRLNKQGGCIDQGLRYGLMLNSLFMRRVEEDGVWTLFCPSDAPNLAALHGPSFDDEYVRLEANGLGLRTFKARKLWKNILATQIDCGWPSTLFKEAVHAKGTRRGVGTVSQGCTSTDVLLWASQARLSRCHTASLVLPSFVTEDNEFDFDSLVVVVRQLVSSLSNLFKSNALPLPDLPEVDLLDSMTNRPLGIGVQGLADTFALLGLPYDSNEARRLSISISETIQHSALDQSADLARTQGAFPDFETCSGARGLLTFDLWPLFSPSNRFDWTALKAKVSKGIHNSELTAYSATGDTSKITGCSNACDPFPRLSFSPEGVTGVPTAFPKHLLELLESKGLWNNRIRECILRNQGSIQGIDCIPIHIRDRYKTAWDVDPAVVLQMAVDRAPAICQSQSVTLCLADPSVSQLTTFVYKCWRSGMKTGLFRIYAPIRGSFSSGRISSVRDGGDDGSSAFVAGTGTVSDPLIMNGL